MPAERTKRNNSSNTLCAPLSTAKNLPCVNSQYFGNVTLAPSSDGIIVIDKQDTMPCSRGNEERKTTKVNQVEVLEAQITSDIYFPVGNQERETYRTKTGKRVTSHQWDVYDFTMKIPKGNIATYKDVALIAGGSPRSVGNALRNNPFAPYVPCHRVIASNHFVGGFFGEWGKDHKTGTRCNQKLELLSLEGVEFDDKGYLLQRDTALWKPQA